MKSLVKTLFFLSLVISLVSLFGCRGHGNAVSKSGGVAFTPEAVLPVGQDFSQSVNPYTGESGLARKGTVAATLNNVALLNKLLKPNYSDSDYEQIKEIMSAIGALVPSLVVIGMFDLFDIEEWITAQDQPGRIMAAVLCLQQYPQRLTNPVKIKLQSIITSSVPVLQDEISKIVKP